MPPSAALDRAFAAMADPTRRSILARLALGEATVSELAEPFRISQPAVSRHVRVLLEAGLIEQRVDLFLFVKIRENWGNDPERYREIGLEFPKD